MDRPTIAHFRGPATPTGRTQEGPRPLRHDCAQHRALAVVMGTLLHHPVLAGSVMCQRTKERSQMLINGRTILDGNSMIVRQLREPRAGLRGCPTTLLRQQRLHQTYRLPYNVTCCCVGRNSQIACALAKWSTADTLVPSGLAHLTS